MFAFSELAPWKLRGEAGTEEHGGVYTEIVRELARRVGRRLEIVDCPYKRCLRLMETGQADLAIGVIETRERDVYMKFLRTPHRSHSADRVFYVRAGDASRIRSYSDLYGLTIGVANGGVYFERFDSDARLTKEVAADNATNFQKLMLHRVDAVAIAEDQAAALRSEMHLESQLEPAQLHIPDLSTRSVAVSKRSKAMAMLPALEKAMHDMRSDGTLAALYDRHYYTRYGLNRRQVKVD
ncbi:transporter substrate-binding domain-containing protein [Paucibacter sp. R3-3]|uniref:Transporter substrate-binding domain-containing protein n=1 Tax=Roseateles agri TaxID=3098619 RepID=A0ABU5DNA1_9BURK|nr:transporter substrate-binding domain-containing protein [Paucibacter sp. R3-3]MDY0747805.1 transporter substrate-binding domain-containing protein [Paucibacter sp. R3-3]